MKNIMSLVQLVTWSKIELCWFTILSQRFPRWTNINLTFNRRLSLPFNLAALGEATILNNGYYIRVDK